MVQIAGVFLILNYLMVIKFEQFP